MISEPPMLIETLFSRTERILLWLAIGVGAGCWKAGNWIQEGVVESVAWSFGAAVTLDVLMFVWVLYAMLTTGVRVWRRLWPRRGQGSQGQ